MMDKSQKKSLKKRLVMQFAAFVAAIVIFLTSAVMVLFVMVITNNLRSFLSMEVESSINTFEQHIDNLAENTKNFSRNHFVINSLIDTPGRSLYLPQLINDFNNSHEISTVTVVDFEGNVIYSTLKKSRGYQNLKQLRSVLDTGRRIVQLSDDQKNIIFIEPIEYYQTPQGAVIVELDLKTLVLHVMLPDKAAFYNLYNKNKLLYSQNYDGKLSYISVRKKAGSSYYYMNRLDLVIEKGVLRKAHLVPVLRALIPLILIGLSFIIISIILAARIGGNISRPVLLLCERVRKASRGELQKCSPIDTDDELEELAQVFDHRTAMLSNIGKKLEKQTEELMLANEKLRMDIAKRKEVEDKILTQSEFLKNVLESLAHPFYVIDANDYTLKLTNSSAMKENFIEGAKCYAVTHGLDEPCSSKEHICPIEKIKETKEPVIVDHIHFNSDGDPKYVEVHGHPIFDEKGNVAQIIEYTLDISDRKKAEEEVQRHLSRLNALHSIDNAIISSFDIKLTSDVLLTQVITQMGVDAVTILRLNSHTALLEYIGGKGFRTDALKYTRLKLGESNAGRAALERRTVTMNNLREDIDGFVRSEMFPDEGFVSYVGVPLIAKGEVKGVLELFHRSTLNTDPGWMDFLLTLAGQAAIALDNAALFEEMQRSNIELVLAYDSTIEGWSRALDLRDKETEGHSQRVTDMTVRIAGEMGLNDEKIAQIRRGALLHDIGKMGVPDRILLKPGKLTDEEWEIMKRHSQFAYDMLKNTEYLQTAIEIPYCHHEKWDGKGYPRGLKGKEIPLGARIFAIVDVWDALRSDRPYRPAWAKEKTIEHIRLLSGTHRGGRVCLDT